MFIQFYNQPGLRLPLDQQIKLRNELLEIAEASLHPVPNYQCLSSRQDALNDKLIVVAYEGEDQARRAVAFTSAVFLDVPAVKEPIVHTGLTVIMPHLRRTGVVLQLIVHLFLRLIPRYPDGLWVTTLAEVLTSLVHTSKLLLNAYPSPSVQRPSWQHLEIARSIDTQHRSKLLISPTAVFDEGKFVFLGSNDWADAACFRKDVDDPQYWHRDSSMNEYFHGLFRRGKGDEVLQVGFVNAERAIEVKESIQQKAKL